MEDNKISFGKNEKTCLIEAIKKANSYKNLKVKLEWRLEFKKKTAFLKPYIKCNTELQGHTER